MKFVSVLAVLAVSLAASIANSEVLEPADEVFIEKSGLANSTVAAKFSEHLPLTGVDIYWAKVLDKNTGTIKGVFLDSSFESVDYDALVDKERQARYNIYGNLEERLFDKLGAMNDNDVVDVKAWVRTNEPNVPEKDLIPDPVAHNKMIWERKYAIDTATQAVADRINAMGFSCDIDNYFPFIRAKLPKSTIQSLQFWSDITRLSQYNSVGIPTSDHYANAVGASTLDSYGWDGTGVKVAVMEAKRPDNISCLSISETYCNGNYSDHSRWTAGIIRSTSSGSPCNTPNAGIANNATVYIANWDGCEPVGPDQALAWAVNTKAADIINFSYSFAGCSDTGLNDNDMAFDYVARRSPFPLIVASAGNYSNCGDNPPQMSQARVMNKCHNCLVVGAVDDKDSDSQTDDEMSSDSLYANPYSDRELPNLVAPGVSLPAAGATKSGTSGASPIVAGIAADLMEKNTALNGWPEAVRAIMMATAHEDIEGGQLVLGGSDDKDGAGEIDGVVALTIGDANYKYNGNSNIIGHDYFTMSRDTGWDQNGDHDNEYFVSASTNSRLRVVIAWDSNPSCTTNPYTCTSGSDTLDADIDLKIYNQGGSVVGSSASASNAWEFIDIPVDSGMAYKIVIHKYSFTSSYTYFGIAWMRYNP